MVVWLSVIFTHFMTDHIGEISKRKMTRRKRYIELTDYIFCTNYEAMTRSKEVQTFVINLQDVINMHICWSCLRPRKLLKLHIIKVPTTVTNCSFKTTQNYFVIMAAAIDKEYANLV